MKGFVLLIISSLFALSLGCASKNKKLDNKQEVAPAQSGKSEAKVTKQDGTDQSYNCLVREDTRTVTLDKEPNRCEVHYTKFGNTEQVAWAEATPSICSEVFSKIRKNIEDRGFKCTSGLQKLTNDKKTAQLNEEDGRSTASSK